MGRRKQASDELETIGAGDLPESAEAPAKPLLSLEAHQLAAFQAWKPPVPSGPNGIACPNCRAELEDCGRLNISYMGIPRSVFMQCSACDYRGDRYLFPGEVGRLG